MMSIKGLFNRNENNDEEIQKLTKRVQTLEQQVKKINSIDVHMNRLLKLESKWKKETISSQYNNNERKGPPKRSDKNTTKNRETFIAVEEHFILQLSKFISETMAPIQSKVNSLDERLDVMEGHFAMMERIIEKNRQQTMELKDELEKLKKNSIPKMDEQSVVIREIKVDKILLDKYEQNNNFGSLGIKDLGGQLNIGATYGSSTLPTEIAEDLKADFESFKQESEDKEDAGDESSVEDSEESSWQSSEESNEMFSEHQDDREQKRVIDNDDDFTEIPIE